ncbi:hypothetical protein N1851_002507 [Merluccius polli]|uniref:Uncharacterized protein n=1 Tax=Merluccius polli TaxID=89951 RepID=A0AA47NA06_MERPO|nr:hypothetical protein N1851_002507 [Merluccius polli]
MTEMDTTEEEEKKARRHAEVNGRETVELEKPGVQRKIWLLNTVIKMELNQTIVCHCEKQESHQCLLKDLEFTTRAKEGNRQLKPKSFIIRKEYATLTFNKSTKNHKDASERKQEQPAGIHVSATGQPTVSCGFVGEIPLVVAAQSSHLLSPSKEEKLTICAMYVAIAHGGKLPWVHVATHFQSSWHRDKLNQILLVKHHHAETTMLSRGQMMTVTGHKCDSSLQSYCRLNYNEQRYWSNILASGSVQ